LIKKCSWEYVFRIVGIISVSLSFIDFVILRYLYIFCLSVYLFMHLLIVAVLTHTASLPKPGVVIVQDYMGLPQQPGHQMVHADEAWR
jgi:hypothetical protein